MGLMSTSSSICHLTVTGDFPASSEFKAFVAEGLKKTAFQDISQGAAEISVGWVHFDDSARTDFVDLDTYARGNYIALTMRVDTRKVPAALLKREIKFEVAKYKNDRPGLTRVPKQEMDEIKDLVKERLLAKTLPVPATYDAVWDTNSNQLTFASLSTKTLDLFDELFKRAFPGLRVVLVCPYNRAEQVVPERLRPALSEANQAKAEAGVLELIADNGWIGQDFLRWFLGQTLNGEMEYHLPAGKYDGATFAAYMNNKMAMIGETTEGKQKVTVSGPQDEWGEAKLALRAGKLITDATLIFEMGEEQWLVNLKTERFYFAGLKTPKVVIEKDDAVDELSEREAAFFEKMHLLEKGLHLFDHVFACFLQERLEGWKEASDKISALLA